MDHVSPAQIIGVLMTGMGNDGAEAMARLHARGGRTIAEAEETAVVWGMPGELVAANGADWVLPLPEIAGWLRNWRPDMPLVRKPPPQLPPRRCRLPRRRHGRRALGGGAGRGRKTRRVAVLAAALSRESDPRVREAIFTGLARIATAESAAAVLPYLRSDDAGLRTAALDALRAMPQAAAAICRLCSPTRRRCPSAELRARARAARRGGQPAAVRAPRGGDRKERLRRGGRGAGRDRPARGLALPGALRDALRRRPLHRLQHQGRDRRIWRRRARHVSEIPPVSEEEFRKVCEFLYRRTGMLFTEAKRYYVQRRISDRMALLKHSVLRDLFCLSSRRRRRRGRKVHQRLHRQRDLFLSRGPSAPLPVLRSAE